MKIVNVPRRFVTSHWGGTETVVLETARRLIASGHEVSIFTPSVFSDCEHEEIDGVLVRRFSYSYPTLGLSDQARIQLDHRGGNLVSWPLRRALRVEPGVDLIHLHTMKRLGGIVRREAMRRRIPYVVSVHGGLTTVPVEEQRDMLAPLRGTLEWGRILGLVLGSRKVLADADAVICVSELEANNLRELHPEKAIHFLPNGVDCAKFAEGDGRRFRQRHEIPIDATLLLVMARIDPQKNQQAAVDVLERLIGGPGRSARLMLAICGPVTDDAYAERLRRSISDRRLDAEVVLLPGLPPGSTDLVDAYHAADVLLVPSRHEPFGIAILEGWAAGLPVVAARVGGIPGFVEDGHDALLFDPARMEDLSGCVLRVLDDASLRRTLVEGGRRKVRGSYDWSQVTSRLEALYAGLCDRRARSSAS